MNISSTKLVACSSPKDFCKAGLSTADKISNADCGAVTCPSVSPDGTGEAVPIEGCEDRSDAREGRVESGPACRSQPGRFDTGTEVSIGSPCETGSSEDVAGLPDELPVDSSCGTGVDGCCCAFGSAGVLDSATPGRTGDLFHIRADESSVRRGDVTGWTCTLVVGNPCWTGADSCTGAFGSRCWLDSDTPVRTGEVFCVWLDVPSVSRGTPAVVTSWPVLSEPWLISFVSPSR